MATPPDPILNEGPLCKVCSKPMRTHSFMQQQRCLNEAKKRGIDLC